MALSKYRIGDLISVVDERNEGGLRNFYGINIEKEFMPTVADTDGLDSSKYKVVRKGRFVFSGMKTGRDCCIRIGLYDEDDPVIVSPAYVTFEVAAEKVLPTYFFMWFLSPEKDRLGWFYSDGSIRSNLDWDRFCDIEMELPDLPTQQKYVSIYAAMLENQRSYARGLEDLKLVCGGYIDDLCRKFPRRKIGPYLQESDRRNEEGLGLEQVRGLATSKEMIPTKADMAGVDLANYRLVEPRQFAYVPDTSRRGDKVSLGLNQTDRPVLVSSISTVFGSDESALLPEYLMLFFRRAEFDRYARFHSWGSAREAFDFSSMCDMEIPIPDISVQRAIAEIFAVYNERKGIYETWKAQMKELCPVLIRGSLTEGAGVGAQNAEGKIWQS